MGTKDKRGTSRPWLVPLAVAVVAAVVVLPLLGSTGLWDPHESMAAEIAREAAEEGAWLPLRFDGQPVAGLPPLFFWVEAVAMAMTGTSEWAVRLPMALLGVAWLLAILHLASRVLGRRAGVLAALALATSALFVLGARHTSPDLAAAMILTLAMLQCLCVITRRGSPGGRDRILLHVLAAALLPGAGLLPLACLAAAIAAGPLLGTIPARSLSRLVPRRWEWIPWSVAGLWIVGGLATSGAAFAGGFFTIHPFAQTTLHAFERPWDTSFIWQIVQAGHMAYPWFIAVPAAIVWLAPASRKAEEEGENPDARIASLHLLLAVPVIYLIATSLAPGYLPLDMLPAAPPLVILAAWGLARVPLLEGEERFRILLPLGGILVLLGAGSQGVDFFWDAKRVLEVGGYMFDRVYPDLGAIGKAFHTALAILVGISAAPVTFLRRRASVMPVMMLAAAFAVAGFEVIHVFQTFEPHLSVGPLARAYEEHASPRDRLVAIEVDPQIRGGHVFYFRRAMTDAGGLEALPELMDEAAGRERLVIVTSHVRALYNDAYALTCGKRIEPLNEERRWYSISALESAPHMPWFRIVVPGGRAGARISRPFETPLTSAGKKVLTFLGWNASAGKAGGTDVVPAGEPIRIPRPGWIDMELFFRVEAGIETGWRVLLDAIRQPGGSSLKGHHLPACGRYPTHMWQPGEVVRDRYFLHVPSGTEPGTYRLRTGFYRENERMRVEMAGPPGSRPREQVTILLGTFVVE